MDEHRKTIVCSVLFLDIVEYSKQSVAGEISLKERFNFFLSSAIRDVPLTDRIILDTGDGAAISFLGDVSDALKVALALRELFASDLARIDPPLLVRVGINLGPVRLVRDINDQPNIIGDGINVAQRVMNFSVPGQIVVTRSYYEAVSHLSPEYADMFFYQGSRTDKHVRAHEIYATDFLSEPVLEPDSINGTALRRSSSSLKLEQFKALWQRSMRRFAGLVNNSSVIIREAPSRMRIIYLGTFLVAFMFGNVLMGRLAPHIPEQPVSVAAQSVDPRQAQSVASPLPSVHPADPVKVADEVRSMTKQTQGILSVSCLKGSEVFVDDFKNAFITVVPLKIRLSPGRHRVTIVRSGKPAVYSRRVAISPGKTTMIKPAFCN